MRHDIDRLLAEASPDRPLPGPLYHDEAVYERELAAIFGREWLFACAIAELPEPGSYVTLTVGRNPVIVLRDADGEIRAFHNTCRHRGSRLCKAEAGRTRSLVCPYHQWTYDLSGRLVAANAMGDGFDRSLYPLKPVHARVVAGLVYICLAAEPPSLDRFAEAVTPYIAPHQPERTKVAFQSTIVEKANWKLVIENNRECYHCAGSHPELLVSLVEATLPDDPGFGTFEKIMARQSAAWDALGLPHAPADGGLEFRCIRLPFNEGAVSMTADGGLACKKLLGDFVEPDLGSVRMFHVPNNWNHFLSDHILHFRVLPLGPHETEVRTTWLVHEDALEGWDYDVRRLTEVWLATNEEDRVLAEENFLGVRSDAYEPGPYAPQAEFMLVNFMRWYLGAMRGGTGRREVRLAADRTAAA